jgi:hypothetical protein
LGLVACRLKRVGGAGLRRRLVAYKKNRFFGVNWIIPFLDSTYENQQVAGFRTLIQLGIAITVEIDFFALLREK